jgi:hypothetical protein
VEIFNLFNRTNRANPTATFTSSSFGELTQTKNASSASGLGFGEPRNVQRFEDHILMRTLSILLLLSGPLAAQSGKVWDFAPGSRIDKKIVTPAYAIAAQYDPTFNSEWILDREKGIARLANPTPKMKNYTVPILTMIGCLATAPPGGQVYRANDLGPFGGNMD